MEFVWETDIICTKRVNWQISTEPASEPNPTARDDQEVKNPVDNKVSGKKAPAEDSFGKWERK